MKCNNPQSAAFFNNGVQYIVGAEGSKLNVYVSDGNSNKLNSVDAGEKITAPTVVILNSANQYQILIGTNSGKLLIFSPGNLIENSQLVSTNDIASEPIISIAADGDKYFSVLTATKVIDRDGNVFSSSETSCERSPSNSATIISS